MILISIYGEVLPISQIGFMSCEPIKSKGFLAYAMSNGIEIEQNDSYEKLFLYTKAFNGDFFIFNLRADGNNDRILGFSSYGVDSGTLRNMLLTKWEKELKESGRTLLTISDIVIGEKNG